MSHRRIPKRNAVLAGAGAVGIAAAAILLPQANASQEGAGKQAGSPRQMSAASAAGLLQQLGEQLGDSYGGAYYDADRQQLVVNVAGNSDAAEADVEKAGAVARSVQNSLSALTSAMDSLRGEASVPGTAWAVDPRTNQVLVTADRTVTGERWDTVENAVRGLGDGVARIQKSKGEFKPFIEGGDAIFGGGSRCSLGFNVTAQDGRPGFLTAGHCGVAVEQWSEQQNGRPIATVQEAVFPGEGDFALVTYDDPNVQAPSAVDTGDGQIVEIKQAAEAAVGLQVFRMGSTTGLRDGQVTGLDATVNYPEGTVSGLIQTDVCAEPGDSGGALFTRDGNAIGLTSGGSGDCTSGGETFFQPVTTALDAVGAQIGSGGTGNGGADNGGTGEGGADNGGTGDSGGDNGGTGDSGGDNDGTGDSGGDNDGAGDGGAQDGAVGGGADDGSDATGGAVDEGGYGNGTG
ncbi:S1 family peptidase [Streptomyces sp. HUAS MG47]|uniref:S1 family peptidase n=1 Tax=Streptomyces solicamelliae TaxID=3231716 RepID=UPI0038779521